MYQEVQVERLYEKIVEQIEASILRGDLKPGDRLPAERELSRQFGVGRSAVREAVKTLTQKGLVEVQLGKGTFVTNGTSRAMRNSLGLLLKMGRKDDYRNLVEVRRLLEPEIAALAAVNSGEDQIDALREAVAVMDQSLQDVSTFVEADMDFHLALAEGSRNSVILLLLESLVDLLRELRSKIAQVEGGMTRAQEHHKLILQAVEKHDPLAARAAMQAHMQQVDEDSQTALEL